MRQAGCNSAAGNGARTPISARTIIRRVSADQARVRGGWSGGLAPRPSRRRSSPGASARVWCCRSMIELAAEGAENDRLSMHSATNGQVSQDLLLVSSGQQGMSSDMAWPSSDIAAMLLPAPGTAIADVGVASGASTSPTATSSITKVLANRVWSIRHCRMVRRNLQIAAHHDLAIGLLVHILERRPGHPALTNVEKRSVTATPADRLPAGRWCQCLRTRS